MEGEECFGEWWRKRSGKGEVEECLWEEKKERRRRWPHEIIPEVEEWRGGF